MKKILFLLSISLVFFTSCSDDDDNIDFDTIGLTIDLTGVDFLAPDFAINFSFVNNGIDVFDSDTVLVYRLEDVFQGQDVWEPLPTAPFFFFNDTTGAIEGFLNYRFNFTIDDVDIILDFDTPAVVGPEFTENQIFRIVVVPAEFTNDPSIDISNINEVMSALKINNKNIAKISMKQ